MNILLTTLKEFVFNPWVIGIGTIIIGGLVLKILDNKNTIQKSKNKVHVNKSVVGNVQQASGNIQNFFNEKSTQFPDQSKAVAEELWKRIVKRKEEIVDFLNMQGSGDIKKIAKNLSLTRQYFEKNRIYFNESFKKKFHSLYYRGFQASLASNSHNLTELYSLIDEFEKEVKSVITNGEK